MTPTDDDRVIEAHRIVWGIEMPGRVVRRSLLVIAVCMVVVACGGNVPGTSPSGAAVATSAGASVPLASTAPSAMSPSTGSPTPAPTGSAASASSSPAPASPAPATASSTPTTRPAATASPSNVARACMPKATRKLFLDHVTDLASLSRTQRAGIVSALKAYDFPTAKGDTWRDSMVNAVSTADSVAARTGAIALSNGTITLKACP